MELTEEQLDKVNGGDIGFDPSKIPTACPVCNELVTNSTVGLYVFLGHIAYQHTATEQAQLLKYALDNGVVTGTIEEIKTVLVGLGVSEDLINAVIDEYNKL